MWIVTTVFNDHDQHGEYFVAAFLKKPDFHTLKKKLLGLDNVTTGKLTRGGGRQKYECQWWYLVEVKDGENVFD